MRPPEVQGATACFPGVRFGEAVRRLVDGVEEPLLGRLGTAHVQLCPQNFGVLDEAAVERLRGDFPAVRFRLHANVRVLRQVYRFSASDFSQDTAFYFRRLAEISRALEAEAYTLHAGRRHCTLGELRCKVQALEDLFGMPVGVEGHYPAPRNRWLLSDWDEYRWLLESGLRFVADLSHLHIVACATGRREERLVEELLACDRCIEIHVSANDGRRDLHRPMDRQPWWWPLLERRNPKAVVFSEGNHLAITPRV